MKKIFQLTSSFTLTMFLLMIPLKNVFAKEADSGENLSKSIISSSDNLPQHLPPSADINDEEEDTDNGDDDSKNFDRLWDVSTLG